MAIGTITVCSDLLRRKSVPSDILRSSQQLAMEILVELTESGSLLESSAPPVSLFHV